MKNVHLNFGVSGSICGLYLKDRLGLHIPIHIRINKLLLFLSKLRQNSNKWNDEQPTKGTRINTTDTHHPAQTQL